MGKYNHQYRNRKFFEELEEEKERIGPTPNKGIIVNAEFVRIREEPSLSSEIVGVIRRGREVDLLEEVNSIDKIDSLTGIRNEENQVRYKERKNRFYKIFDEYEDRSGYISSEYIQEVR